MKIGKESRMQRQKRILYFFFEGNNGKQIYYKAGIIFQSERDNFQ